MASARNATKGSKIGRALRSAARFPAKVSGGRGSGRHYFSPRPGEHPAVYLRLQVIGCKDLLAKDRNGSTDPFVVVSLLSNRHQTPVSRKNKNPTYDSRDATFDFPIYLSLADKLCAVELVVWDKDVLRKEYLGEVALPLEDWFQNENTFAFDDPSNKSFSVNLLSTRTSTHATGSVQIKLGFVPALHSPSQMDFDEVFGELVKHSRPSLVSAPPTESIGTIRSHLEHPAFDHDDDSGTSSDDDANSEEDLPPSPFPETFHPPSPLPPHARVLPISDNVLLDFTHSHPSHHHHHHHHHHHQQQQQQPKQPPPELNLPISPSTPTPAALAKTPTPSRSSTASFIPRIFPRRQGSAPADIKCPSTPESPGADTYATLSPSTPTPTLASRPRSAGGSPVPTPSASSRKGNFRVKWVSRRKTDYNFSTSNDIVGIVMLDIQGATDLPRLKNMTRTGWDMDPFVVVSFSKKVFRTRVIRHSLNPVWDEKLLFHVRRYETNFRVQLTVLDWDKLSSNDYVGDASFDVSELLADAPQRDPETGLYAELEGDHPMKEFSLPLTTAKEMPWEAKHRPILVFRAKYQPYDALRQRFWLQYMKQYDMEETGGLTHLEFTSMLDSLGSTLSRKTLDTFFEKHNKKPYESELTYAEAIQCLEAELGRPDSERKRIEFDDSTVNTNGPTTPGGIVESESTFMKMSLGDLDFSGPPLSFDDDDIFLPSVYSGQEDEQLLHPLAQCGSSSSEVDVGSDVEADKTSDLRGAGDQETFRESDGYHLVERVINVKNCPLCHRPRLSSKAEVDIVTHLAVCASQDWAKVDRIVVGTFVTASQAQRKWYTKVISKVSSGNYKLGANSANIIVQNRLTGQLEEEKMQVYVRLGIRLLYKGAKSRMEGARARKLLKSLSIKQGHKYDSPESARDILPFIEFYGLKIDEIMDPIETFKTFNQFFYRKLKPSARPVECPDDPCRLVSAADCRIMVFESIHDATRIWIKGRGFTVARLLGDAYRDVADNYNGGALAIFRLAPQDYHRFHSPVEGKIGAMTYISGEYYTVNPQAIRTALDVYAENARHIIPINSPQFGCVTAVCVGAMMVGSIHATVNEGDSVVRGQELGYFAYGGSTVVVLFEKGVVEWDEDLLVNGRAALETLVRVGMGVGRRQRVHAHPAIARNASPLPHSRSNSRPRDD